jgi:adenylate kinase
MTETPKTTVNGFEIHHPREMLSFGELSMMLSEYGLGGSNPKDRVEELRKLSTEQITLLMADINRRIQGSERTLVYDGFMSIDGEDTVTPDQRYTVLSDIVDKIKKAPDSINPERIGDTLALATVLTHPFVDGSGRTARVLGLIFS